MALLHIDSTCQVLAGSQKNTILDDGIYLKLMSVHMESNCRWDNLVEETNRFPAHTPCAVHSSHFFSLLLSMELYQDTKC